MQSRRLLEKMKADAHPYVQDEEQGAEHYGVIADGDQWYSEQGYDIGDQQHSSCVLEREKRSMMSAATIPPIPLQAIIMPTTEASKVSSSYRR